MTNKNKIALTLSLIVLGVLLVFTAVNNNEVIKTTYNEFLNYMEKGQVNEVFLSEDESFTYTVLDKKEKYLSDNPRKSDFKETLLLQDIVVSETYLSYKSFLQIVFTCGTIAALFYFIIRNSNSTSKIKAPVAQTFNAVDKEDNIIKLSDIAGNEEAKESVLDVIDFIKNPDKYKKYGARMPKGLIFYGPPGTGKTLMAKAIAGETEAKFYAVSGSDFVQMYVGVGASRIRELFKKASENEKSVIFIDEIDALAKKRRESGNGGNDERDQTLNALLTEMSGFTTKDNVLVIAATNRLDILDEAILRPGRFDRQIEIGLPDINARKSILNYYFKDKPIKKDVSINSLAKQTVYFSGAMLENLVNKASILAAKSSLGSINNKDFDKAYYTIIAGSEKLDRSAITKREREVTAFHESGHALLTKLLLPENSVAKVTIIPSTKGAGGFSVNIAPDKMFYTKKELESEIMVLLGGRIAEELIFGSDNITTGAGNDIERATDIAKGYVTTYGMSKRIGLINTSRFNNDDSIKSECTYLIEKLYKKAKVILKENLNTLTKIADSLLEKETLKEEELDIIMSKNYTLNVVEDKVNSILVNG